MSIQQKIPSSKFCDGDDAVSRTARDVESAAVALAAAVAALCDLPPVELERAPREPILWADLLLAESRETLRCCYLSLVTARGEAARQALLRFQSEREVD